MSSHPVPAGFFYATLEADAAAVAKNVAEVRRLLFIETSSAGAQLWAGFLPERTPSCRPGERCIERHGP